MCHYIIEISSIVVQIIIAGVIILYTIETSRIRKKTKEQTESLKQNNGLVQSNRLPRFILDKNDNITLTQAGKVEDFLLRLYFGVNSKFFEEKLSVAPAVELELK